MRTILFALVTLVSTTTLAGVPHGTRAQIEECEEKISVACENTTLRDHDGGECSDETLHPKFVAQCGEGQSAGESGNPKDEIRQAKAMLKHAKQSMKRAKIQAKHAKRVAKLGKLKSKASKALAAVKIAECVEERTGPDGGISEGEAKALCTGLASK